MIHPVSSQLSDLLRLGATPASSDEVGCSAVNSRVASSNLARGAEVSVSRCEDLIQSSSRPALAFQMWIAKAVMIAEFNSAVAIAILNEKFDSGPGFVRVFDRALELVGIKRNSVDGDDLSTDGQPDLVRRPIPQHVD